MLAWCLAHPPGCRHLLCWRRPRLPPGFGWPGSGVGSVVEIIPSILDGKAMVDGGHLGQDDEGAAGFRDECGAGVDGGPAAVEAAQADPGAVHLGCTVLQLSETAEDPFDVFWWWGIAVIGDTPPPEDVERIFRSFTELKNGATQVHIPGVRLRRLDGGWTTVDARATLIPKIGVPLHA